MKSLVLIFTHESILAVKEKARVRPLRTLTSADFRCQDKVGSFFVRGNGGDGLAVYVRIYLTCLTIHRIRQRSSNRNSPSLVAIIIIIGEE